MRNRVLLFILGAVAMAVIAGDAAACPGCRYSPHGWGFCGYDFYAGYYDCREYVADDWTGRTACSMCGYCNWGNPSSNVPCSAGNPRDPENPTSLLEEGCPWSPETRSKMLVASHDLSWVGARVDDVTIF